MKFSWFISHANASFKLVFLSLRHVLLHVVVKKLQKIWIYELIGFLRFDVGVFIIFADQIESYHDISLISYHHDVAIAWFVILWPIDNFYNSYCFKGLTDLQKASFCLFYWSVFRYFRLRWLLCLRMVENRKDSFRVLLGCEEIIWNIDALTVRCACCHKLWITQISKAVSLQTV